MDHAQVIGDVFISRRGTVFRRLMTGRCFLLKPVDTPDGYKRIYLKGKNYFVHRLVAERFVAPYHGENVNHKDGNKHNNLPENLEWCTRAYNIQHTFDVLGRRALRGEQRSKLKAKDVLDIRQRAAEGVSRRDLAREYGITVGGIRKIILKETWAHI